MVGKVTVGRSQLGRSCGPLLLSRAKPGSHIQVGAGEVVCREEN